MKMNIVRDLKEAFKFENIATTLCTVTAAVVYVLHLTAHGFSEHGLLLVIVLMLGFLAAATVVERITHLNPIKDSLKKLSEPRGISAFYMNRKNKPKMEAIFAATKDEFFWVGNIGTMMIHNFQDQLSSLAKRGCKVRLLMMHPYGPNISNSPLPANGNPLLQYFGALTVNSTYAGQLKLNLQRLEDWLSELRKSDPTASAKIEVRFYTELVTLVMIFVDPKQPDGSANVEILPHKFAGSQRPSFDISKADPTSNELFRHLVKTHEDLWDNSQSFNDLMLLKGSPSNPKPGVL